MELWNRLFYSLLGGGVLFYLVVKVSLAHWKKRGILHEKPKFFWGNLKGFTRKHHITDILQSLYQKYKSKAPFIGFFAFLKPLLLILDLDLVQRILSLDAAFFLERGLYHNTEDDHLTENLMQLDGHQWYQLHEKIKPRFSHDNIKAFLPALQLSLENFMKSLKEQQSSNPSMDIKNLTECLNIDVMAYLVFGEKTNTLNSLKQKQNNSQFSLIAKTFDRGLSLKRNYFLWDFPNLARIFRCQVFDSDMSRQFQKILNSRLNDEKFQSSAFASSMHNLNFLHLLLSKNPQTRQESGEEKKEDEVDLSLSRTEIAGQSFSFILAGLKPSIIAMSYCLYEMALQPEIQDKARQEIQMVMAKAGHSVNQQTLEELKYLKQILYETLRKHSPYPVILRKVSEDYDVPNSTFMLEKGNQLLIPIAAIHHDPEIYENPDKFDPDRFTPDNMKKRHPMAWLPFGKGIRGCLADKFAEQIMLFGLMKLLSSYEFSPCAETPIPVKYDSSALLSTPKCAITLKLTSI